MAATPTTPPAIPPLSHLVWQLRPARRTRWGEETETQQATVQLTDVELKPFAEFLEEPYRHGYWRLTGKWRYDGLFSQFVYEQLGARLFSSLGNVPGPQARALGRVSPELEQLLSEAFGRISTVLETYTLALGSMGGAAEPEATTQRRGIEYQIDMPAFKARFAGSLKLFQDSIHFPQFKPLISDRPFRTATGVIFLVYGPREREKIVIACDAPRPLQDFGNFLKEAGQLDGPLVEKVFSPEEELFEPYFTFLSAAYSGLIDDDRVRPQFRQAFEYFSRRDFVHCISTLGLVAEDYLAQVFESYLREPCPKGLTLGQIYDQLHHNLRDLLMPDREELRPLDAIYEEITALNQLQGPDGIQEVQNRMTRLTRDVVNLLRTDRKHYTQRIDDLHRRDQRISLFGPLLRDNLNELIRNRNAASHKTRVPLGNYEALRTLYCLTSFVLWWKRTRASTNWGRDREVIIRAAIVAP